MLGKVNPLRGNRVDPYLLELKWESNSTSAPDGLDPDYGSDLTVTRTGVGTFEITFAESKKPWRCAVVPFHQEDDANLRLVTSGYTRSTGKIVLKTYTNSAGTWSAADTTDKTLGVLLYCTKSSEGLG